MYWAFMACLAGSASDGACDAVEAALQAAREGCGESTQGSIFPFFFYSFYDVTFFRYVCKQPHSHVGYMADMSCPTGSLSRFQYHGVAHSLGVTVLLTVSVSQSQYHSLSIIQLPRRAYARGSKSV